MKTTAIILGIFGLLMILRGVGRWEAKQLAGRWTR